MDDSKIDINDDVFLLVEGSDVSLCVDHSSDAGDHVTTQIYINMQPDEAKIIGLQMEQARNYAQSSLDQMRTEAVH